MDAIKIALKELKAIKRERTFVTIILLLVFVSSFASLIVYGTSMLYSPSSYAKVAFVGNNSKSKLAEILGAVRYTNLSLAKLMLKEGKIDAVVYSNGNRVIVYIPKNEISTIKALSYIKKKLVIYEDLIREKMGIKPFKLEAVLNGRTIDIPYGVAVAFKFVYVVLVPLLSITTSILSAAVVIDSYCEEVETKTIEALLTATDKISVISGKILAALILSATLNVLWMILLEFNGIDIHNETVVFLMSMAICVLFISLALIVSAFWKNRESSQLVFSTIAVAWIAWMYSSYYSPISALIHISSGGIYILSFTLFWLIVPIVMLTVAILVAMRFVSDF